MLRVGRRQRVCRMGSRRRNEDDTERPSLQGGQAKLRQPSPDPEVTAKATRRRFTACVQAVGSSRRLDACETPGEIGRLLRRAARPVQLASVGVAEGGAGGVAAGAGEVSAARCLQGGSGRRSRCGSSSGKSRGCARNFTQGAHRDRGPGKSCGAAGVELGDGKSS